MSRTKPAPRSNAEYPCLSKPSLSERALLSPAEAGRLMKMFKVLANDTRLRLLHALVQSRELCVTELAELVQMTPQGVSNQLQRLNGSILGSRRAGNQIYYRIIDPCVVELLEYGLCLSEDAESRRL